MLSSRAPGKNKFPGSRGIGELFSDALVFANVLQTCCMRVASGLQTCCKRAANVLQTCCQRVASVLHSIAALVYLFDDAASRMPNPTKMEPLVRLTALIRLGFVSHSFALCANSAYIIRKEKEKAINVEISRVN